MSGFCGIKITKQKIVHTLHFLWGYWEELSPKQHGIHQNHPAEWGLKSPARPWEGILWRNLSGGAFLQKESTLRQYFLWGPLSHYEVGYLANNRDIYLVFLGNYCKLRNLEGAAPERQMPSPDGQEMGQSQLEILLVSFLSLDSAQYLSCYFLPHTHLPPSPCLSAVLPAYICCSTCFHLLCGL